MKKHFGPNLLAASLLALLLAACSAKSTPNGLSPSEESPAATVCGGDGNPIEGVGCDIAFETNDYKFVIEDHPESSTGALTVYSKDSSAAPIYQSTLSRTTSQDQLIYIGDGTRITVYQSQGQTLIDIDMEVPDISVHEHARPAKLSSRLVATLGFLTDSLTPVTDPVDTTVSQVLAAADTVVDAVKVLGTSNGIVYVELTLPGGATQIYGAATNVVATGAQNVAPTLLRIF